MPNDQTNGPREHVRDIAWSTVTDNYEPPRGYASGVLEVWEPRADAEDQTPTYVLADASELKDANRALYIIDNGRTCEPWYVAGWSADGSRVFLQPMPTNFAADGTPRLRADNGRPVDFGNWVLGPRRAYHLKVGR